MFSDAVTSVRQWGRAKTAAVVELWFQYVEYLKLLPPDELMRPEGVPVVSFASCYNAKAVSSDGRLVSLGSFIP
jgi:hypothetical protein